VIEPIAKCIFCVNSNPKPIEHNIKKFHIENKSENVKIEQIKSKNFVRSAFGQHKS
jgi:hypothetical protein